MLVACLTEKVGEGSHEITTSSHSRQLATAGRELDREHHATRLGFKSHNLRGNRELNSMRSRHLEGETKSRESGQVDYRSMLLNEVIISPLKSSKSAHN